MKNTSTTTAAQHLLSLVFEGHQITAYIDNGKNRFNRNEVAAALDIKHVRTSINLHLDPDELGVRKVTVRSANGTTQIRDVATLTESGVLALVCSSKKPAARRFRRWLTGEVLPQLLKYGTYAPGATAGERCHHLRTRWMEERAREKAGHAEALEESGLLTIAAFRRQRGFANMDGLLFSCHLRSIARKEGYEPPRFYTGARRHTPAWPLHLLVLAQRACHPPLFLEYRPEAK